MTKKQIAKIVIWCVGALLLALILNSVLRRKQYTMAAAFYAQPRNTIQVGFVGTSHMQYAVSPMQMYEDVGICGFNLSTSVQPAMASYYWIRELYSLHSASLKAVVMDVSSLFWDTEEDFYRVALEEMRLSENKLQAVMNLPEGKGDWFSYLFPLMKYHDRWEEITSADFSYGNGNSYLRGYGLSTAQSIERNEAQNIYVRTSEWYQPNGIEMANEDSLRYYEQIVDFTKQHGIDLILIKVPTSNWSIEKHQYAAEFAEQQGVVFVDYNSAESDAILDIDYAYESVDNYHMNFFAATRITALLEKDIKDICAIEDIRTASAYEFMKADAELYRQKKYYIDSVSNSENLQALLRQVCRKGYTVYMAVKDEATVGLDDETKAYCASIGLRKLGKLAYAQPYLAVIEDGVVTAEQAGDVSEPLLLKGESAQKTPFVISSAGAMGGNSASIQIGETEYAVNGRGVNIVVFDENARLVASVCFDTYVGTDVKAYAQETEEKRTQYEQRKQNIRLADCMDFATYAEYLSKQQYVSVMVTNDPESYALLANRLVGLIPMEESNLQAAVYADGYTYQQYADEGTGSIEAESLSPLGLSYCLYCDEGAMEATVCGQTFRMDGMRGTMVLVYDKSTASVVDAVEIDRGGALKHLVS